MLRNLLSVALFCVFLGANAQPSVDILGVSVRPGMEKSELTKVLPMFCSKSAVDLNGVFENCSVNDDIPPGADGNITFENNLVVSAYTNHFFMEGSTPFDVALMINQMVNRIAGEDRAVCAKLEANPEIREGSLINPGKTVIAFPDKVLTIVMHTLHGESVHMRESIRVNPVPHTHRVYGRMHNGTDWCAYVD